MAEVCAFQYAQDCRVSKWAILQKMDKLKAMCNFKKKQCNLSLANSNEVKKSVLCLLVCLVVLFMPSCMQPVMYQIYTVKPSSNQVINDDLILFENDDIDVCYYFWSEGGNPGFVIKNKTDKMISVDLNKTFFILNDIAYDYYLDRTITLGNERIMSKSKSGAVFGAFNSLGFLYPSLIYSDLSLGLNASSSESIHDKEIVYIPAKTKKYFMEYNIVKSPNSACELQGGKVGVLNFSKDNSPISFGNIIAYRVGDDGDLKTFNNDFYVSQIKNIKEKHEKIKEKIKECGKKNNSFLSSR